MSVIESDLGYWLAGFIDGEGCFDIVTCRRREAKVVTYQCRFVISLRDDDRPLLEMIHEQTGLGRLLSVKGRGRANPQYRWGIDRKKECQELVCVLDRYPLRSKKAQDYFIWRKAVSVWGSRVRHAAHDYEYRDLMGELKAELMEVRTYKTLIH